MNFQSPDGENISQFLEKKDLSEAYFNSKGIQEAYKRIYGIYDLDKSLIWMIEELGEVVAAIRKTKNLEEISSEIGDLTTWIINISNILSIDLSEALNFLALFVKS
ncbi:MAG: MazG nucleotide pyrophosphohydrolase domain-containing protein [Gammaproteobacteria bacterium]